MTQRENIPASQSPAAATGRASSTRHRTESSAPSKRPNRKTLAQSAGEAAQMTRREEAERDMAATLRFEAARASRSKGASSKKAGGSKKGGSSKGSGKSRSAKRPSRKRPHARARARRAKRPPSSSRKRHFLVFAGILAFFVVFCIALACTGTYNATLQKYEGVEAWRAVTEKACEDCGLGAEWTDDVLAIMFVESGGDEDVESVEGVEHDVMQAAEGAYGDIVKEGSEEYGVEAETCQASIYAGVLEFQQSLELWEGYLGDIGPGDSEKVQLVVQGYNFGANGWFKWCEANGVTAYSVDVAQRYSDEEMPEDAKGTPTHGEKWLEAYERILEDEEG